MSGPSGFRSGFVAIVGRPNTGKSSLVNALVGEKVSIVSDVPQTTRYRIRGILTTEAYQIVFTDTPGLHKPRTLLGERLNEVVGEAAADTDAVIQVVDAAAGIGRGDEFVARDRVVPHRGPAICAVNKIDLVTRERLVPELEAAARLAPFDHVLPISATERAGIAELVDLLAETLPEGPAYFPAQEATDEPIERRVAEIVREKALAVTREEVPHSIAVQTESIEREDGRTRVTCRILVERDSQKGIVIGKRGQMLRRIGTEARPEIEALLGVRIFLELLVKVQKDWQRDPAALTRLGY